MIALRRNGWVARRAEEGPAKIEDIHKKIAQEEYLKQQQQAQLQQQQAPYGGGGGMTSQVIYINNRICQIVIIYHLN